MMSGHFKSGSCFLQFTTSSSSSIYLSKSEKSTKAKTRNISLVLPNTQTNHIVSEDLILSKRGLVSISVMGAPGRNTLIAKEVSFVSTDMSLELRISKPPNFSLNSTSAEPSENS
ncbi:hypothetical protein V8G54_014064 [Vigna mungo]|uniref:Uncharacterized protein n=1 Tax=Vigna mungo TaxID=3915 RepID=A0AAQ3RVK7_VIGMU